jgi:phospholipase A1
VVAGFLFGSFFLPLQGHFAWAQESPVAESFEDIYHYKPMYFLVGEPITKVQLSLKARVIRNREIFVGYTQLMLWDLFKESRPFKDINYNPEIFYRLTLRDVSHEGQSEWFDFGPYMHESNGKNGADSRSWNRVFVRYYRNRKLGLGTKLGLSIQAWLPYAYDPGNEDLPRYRGIYEINLTLSEFLGPFFAKHDLNLRFYPGGKSHINPLQGGRELTLRLKGREKVFLTQVIFQFFQGRGESLLNYRDQVVGFRVGIGI